MRGEYDTYEAERRGVLVPVVGGVYEYEQDMVLSRGELHIIDYSQFVEPLASCGTFEIVRTSSSYFVSPFVIYRYVLPTPYCVCVYDILSWNERCS